jgi:hypothetical protein
MEKISHIVGSSARVTSGDAKSAPPARPGTPTFGGRGVAESPHGRHDHLSTAQRVGILRNHLLEERKLQEENRIASDMAEKFFFKPEEMKGAAISSAHGKVKAEAEAQEEVAPEEPTVHATSARTEALINNEDADLKAPSRFAPRGSYVDVRA